MDINQNKINNMKKFYLSNEKKFNSKLFIKFINILKEINYNDNFEEPKEIDIKEELVDKIFPNNLKIKLNNKFKFTNVSLFSTTPIDQAKYTYDIIKYFIPNTLNKTITDFSSCIGGNTWIFAKKFKKVNAIELSKINYKFLKNNMELLALDNITFYNENCLEYIFELKQDVMFFDPPWGGVDYKKSKKIDVGYVYKSIYFPIGFLVCLEGIKDYCDLVVIKLPLNYDEKYIMTNNKFKYIYNFMVKTKERIIYKILVLTDDKPKTKFDFKNMETFNWKSYM